MKEVKKEVKKELKQEHQAPSAKTERNRRKRLRKRERQIEMQTALDQAVMGALNTIPNATRSGVRPNPADPRTTIKMLANTPGGAAWVLRCLHPNGEGNETVPRIPDGATTNSVAMERRDDFILKCPYETTVSDTWTCMYVQLPFLSRSFVAVAGPDSELTDTAVGACLNIYCNLTSTTYPNYKYPTWGNVSDAGTDVYMTVCPAATLEIDYVNVDSSTSIKGYAKMLRRTYLGITADFDCNELTSKGRITSGQFATQKTEKTVGYNDGTNELVQNFYIIDKPPTLTQQITQQDDKSRQAECITGEYMPLRICQPDVPFVPAADGRWMAPSTSTANGDFSAVYQNLWLDGWSTYVSRWEDMYQTSSIRIKRREGLELVCGDLSPYGPFQQPSLPDDDRARKMVAEFSRVQPHAYCADFNHTGGLLSNIVSGPGNAVGSLGIPVISDMGQTVGNLLGGLGNLLGL